MGFFGSLIGGIFGKKSADKTAKASVEAQKLANEANVQMTRETNQANLDIANATNEANIRIAQMGNEYNREALDRQIQQEWDMWNAENEYNSASAQRQRLEEAGMNPYMQQVDAGIASSMSSPSAQPAVIPQMQGATMQAPQIESASDEILQAGLQRARAMEMLGQGVGGIIDFPIEMFASAGMGAAVSDIMSIREQIAAKKAGAETVVEGAKQSRMQTERDKVDTVNKEALSAAEVEKAQSIAGYETLNFAAKFQHFLQLPQELMLDLTTKMQNAISGILTNSLKAQEIEKIFLENEFSRNTMDARVRQQQAAANQMENNQGPQNVWQLGSDVFSGLTGYPSVKEAVKSAMENVKGFFNDLKGIVGSDKLDLIDKVYYGIGAYLERALNPQRK